MRQAYVVKLGTETNPSQREFAGCVEEVDTGRELRFTSTDELLTFLAECFDLGKKEKAGTDEPCVGVKELSHAERTSRKVGRHNRASSSRSNRNGVRLRL